MASISGSTGAEAMFPGFVFTRRRGAARLVSVAGAPLVACVLSLACLAPALGSAGDSENLDDVEYCVSVGRLLAVAGPNGPTARVIEVPSDARPATTMTIGRPGLVGACADFEMVWEHGTHGSASAALQLVNGTPDDTGPSIGSDAYFRETKGRKLESGELKVTTSVTGTGEHAYVAVLAVDMVVDSLAATDVVSVPFSVIVPDSTSTGAVAGLVRDSGGTPIEGATVGVWPILDQPLEALPDWGLATTGRGGRYWLEVPEGRYSIDARALWYEREWVGGSTGRDAEEMAVAAGEVVPNANLVLERRPATDPLHRGIGTSLSVADSSPGVGATTSMTYELRHKAPLPDDYMNVVLLLDGSASMGGQKNEAVRIGAGSFIDKLDLGQARGIRVAVVEFNTAANLLCPLTMDRAEVWRCIGRLAAAGGTDIEAGLRFANWLLVGGKLSSGQTHEAIVLITDGANSSGCASVLEAADLIKARGTQLSTVCVDRPCYRSCLREAASTYDYYYEVLAHEPQQLVGVLDRVAEKLPLFSGVAAADVEVLLPKYVEFRPGSFEPEPSQASFHRARWTLTELPPYKLELSFGVEVRRPCPIVAEAIADIRVSDGAEAVYEAYLPQELPAPCVSPTPTATRSPSATPLASPTARLTYRALFPWVGDRLEPSVAIAH